ncbi:MAG: DNA-3-methyladenine glycosylase [Thermoplasmata archaeon]|nr:DNA-3-methyladenine glycosylase [Thermoplasmata archaeon]MCI4356430.1 DNA-3-methyladenine glycosylase [Thermoplasmata archaeon]
MARELLGAWIVVRTGRALHGGRIVETEAYVAEDAANHARRGPTPRNRTMFGPPGSLYVYRIHQVHCANAVTRPGEAVLLRAAEPLSSGLPSLSGPGRLCRGLGVTRDDDGTSLVDGRVRIVSGDSAPELIVRAPRVGISRSVELPLRFLWEGHASVSRPRPWGRTTA